MAPKNRSKNLPGRNFWYSWPATRGSGGRGLPVSRRCLRQIVFGRQGPRWLRKSPCAVQVGKQNRMCNNSAGQIVCPLGFCLSVGKKKSWRILCVSFSLSLPMFWSPRAPGPSSGGPASSRCKIRRKGVVCHSGVLRIRFLRQRTDFWTDFWGRSGPEVGSNKAPPKVRPFWSSFSAANIRCFLDLGTAWDFGAGGGLFQNISKIHLIFRALRAAASGT